MFAVVMGLGAVAPAIADHGGLIGVCSGEIYDPNSGGCIPIGTCPNGVIDGHCALDTNINDNQKFVICHQPTKANVTIEVSENAVTKHIAHGDFMGECLVQTPGK